MNLILIEPSELDAGGLARVEGTRARHVLDVLKCGSGDTIRVGVIGGATGLATIENIDGDAIDVRCTWDGHAPPRPRVDLLLALPRPKVMRRLWAQLSALGVGRIILTNAERVERNYFDTNVLSPDVYRPLLVEGLQQAKDTRLPVVSVHRQFKVLVEDHLDEMCPAGLRLAADPSGARSVGAACRAAQAPSDTRALVAVGPEGGWNAFEIALLEAHGFTVCSVGRRTLRSDTACIALVALVHEALAEG